MQTGETKDILVIVERDVRLLDELVAVLRPLFQVWVATNENTLYKQLQHSIKPGMVLMGVKAFDYCAISLCEKIKANPQTADIPVVFIGKTDLEGAEEACFSAGAADYLVVPFASNSLLARVRTHLALSNQSRELKRQVDQRTKELKHTKIKLIHRLGAAAEYRDAEPSGHLRFIAEYSYIIAKGYGANSNWCEQLYSAAPLHDVGKIVLSDQVFQNMGRLAEQDKRDMMQRHCEAGAKILHDEEEPILKMAASIALNHHERFDGSGYPNQLSVDQIPLEARIVAIADTFDAMQTEKHYRKSLPVQEVVDFINQSSGTSFDPQLVSVFNENLSELIKVRNQAAIDV